MGGSLHTDCYGGVTIVETTEWRWGALSILTVMVV